MAKRRSSTTTRRSGWSGKHVRSCQGGGCSSPAPDGIRRVRRSTPAGAPGAWAPISCWCGPRRRSRRSSHPMRSCGISRRWPTPPPCPCFCTTSHSPSVSRCPCRSIATLAVHPNVAGMKESSGDVAQIADQVSSTPERFRGGGRLGADAAREPARRRHRWRGRGGQRDPRALRAPFRARAFRSARRGARAAAADHAACSGRDGRLRGARSQVGDEPGRLPGGVAACPTGSGVRCRLPGHTSVDGRVERGRAAVLKNRSAPKPPRPTRSSDSSVDRPGLVTSRDGFRRGRVLVRVVSLRHRARRSASCRTEPGVDRLHRPARRRGRANGTRPEDPAALGAVQPDLPQPHARGAHRRGQRLLAARRHRLRRIEGVDGIQPRTHGVRARGVDDHAAACEEPLSVPVQEPGPEAAGAHDLASARGRALEEAHPRALPQRGGVGGRCLRCRGGRASALRRAGLGAGARAGSAACRRPDQRTRPRPEPSHRPPAAPATNVAQEDGASDASARYRGSRAEGRTFGIRACEVDAAGRHGTSGSRTAIGRCPASRGAEARPDRRIAAAPPARRDLAGKAATDGRAGHGRAAAHVRRAWPCAC